MDRSLVAEFAAIERDHWWFQGRRQVVDSVLRRCVEPGSHRRVLDVGAGTGEMTDMLRTFGRVTALDVSPEAVAFCRRRFAHDADVDVRCGAIPDDLPTEPSLDLLSAFDVLEHVDDDVATLRAMRRSLAPGGLLVVTVPAYGLLWGQQDVVSHHRRRYRRSDLRRLLENTGFILVRSTYFNTGLFPVIATVRLARRLPPLSHRPPESDFHMPRWPWVNRALQRVFAAETTLLGFGDLPFGVSILAIAQPDPSK